MIVYRFERNGIGPFINRCSGRAWSMHRLNNKHVNKKKAGIEKKYKTDNRIGIWESVEEHHLFGCPSKEALQAYFSFNFKGLFKEGYRIKKYNVPDREIIYMGIQLAFPVKYHRFKTHKRMTKQLAKIHR